MIPFIEFASYYDVFLIGSLNLVYQPLNLCLTLIKWNMSVVKLEIVRLKTEFVSVHKATECHKQLNYIAFDGKNI